MCVRVQFLNSLRSKQDVNYFLNNFNYLNSKTKQDGKYNIHIKLLGKS